MGPRLGGLAALVIMLGGALRPGTALAQEWAVPRTVFVPRTGHTVDGLFLDLWREQRVVIGDPITEELRTRTGLGNDPEAEQIVQYFENAALVYLPEREPGEQVRTLPLGRAALARALDERPAAALLGAARRTACGSGVEVCRGFQETGHTLGAGFRGFWEAAGEGRLLGPPLTEAYRAPDGSWVQYFEGAVLRARSGAGVEPLPIGTAAARELGLDMTRVVRPGEVPLYAAALFVAPATTEPAPNQPVDPALGQAVEPIVEPVLAPEAEPVPEPEPISVPEPEPVMEVVGPGPQQGGYQEIVISISAQMLWAYEGGQLVNSTYVSTGTAEVPETTTPIGSHAILSKVDVQDMEGTISGEHYFVPDVPYVMYFDNLGNALHGTYWHSNFGAPMSHGCVNLPMEVAAWMYGWAGVGTPVTVIG